MSFSKDVKEELAKQIANSRHCKIAELSAYINLCSRIVSVGKDRYYLKISTENLTVAQKCFILIKKTFHVVPDIRVRGNGMNANRLFQLYIRDQEMVFRILKSVKLLNESGDFQLQPAGYSPLVVQNPCCKRAFLRGFFLVCGSITDPEKAYHMEYVTSSRRMAEGLCEIMKFFEIEAKVILRKRNYVVYLKEGTQIVDMLNVMEAHVALMNLENVRILKGVRNSINRQVNCDTANINKTVAAASSQMEDIEYIKHTAGWETLSDGLKEIAQVRLEYPEASLKELGALLNPPIGKSGVNHRLRKLSEIAHDIRERKEEKS